MSCPLLIEVWLPRGSACTKTTLMASQHSSSVHAQSGPRRRPIRPCLARWIARERRLFCNRCTQPGWDPPIASPASLGVVLLNAGGRGLSFDMKGSASPLSLYMASRQPHTAVRGRDSACRAGLPISTTRKATLRPAQGADEGMFLLARLPRRSVPCGLTFPFAHSEASEDAPRSRPPAAARTGYPAGRSSWRTSSRTQLGSAATNAA